MRKLLGVVFALMSAASMSQAAVIGGDVTSVKRGSLGNFEMIDTAKLTVGKNNQQSNNLFAFDEVQNFKLVSDLMLDVGGTIRTGMRISSHYIFFDPLDAQRQKGFVDFGGKILGVATMTSTLGLTDFLGLSSVTYLDPRNRGLEREDQVAIDATNASRLLLNWRASTPGDYIRVITASSLSEVPVPASGLLLLGGFGVLSMMRRRRTV